VTARDALKTIGWGLYCAASWTWCIGMFLPHVMLERFGWPGFIAFAVPNILGCAGFGYVLSRANAKRLRAKHATAMTWFSLVTIAFHIFFVCLLWRWLAPPGVLDDWSLLFAPFILLIGAVIVYGIPDRYWPAPAALVYAISLGVWFTLGRGSLSTITWTGTEPMANLAWMTPIVVLGFLACPYLDLTFYRARLETPSRHAFAVFGVAFGLMILFTCAYWQRIGMTAWFGLLAVHLFAQSMLTVGVHLREMERAGDRALLLPKRLRNATIVLMAMMLLLAGFATSKSMMIDMYLRFFVFYGLIFPAYVVIVMPTATDANRGHVARNVFLTTLALAIFCELGFLHGYDWLLTIPVATVLIWSASRRRGRTAQGVVSVDAAGRSSS
jgi:hypothetical protein